MSTATEESSPLLFIGGSKDGSRWYYDKKVLVYGSEAYVRSYLGGKVVYIHEDMDEIQAMEHLIECYKPKAERPLGWFGQEFAKQEVIKQFREMEKELENFRKSVTCKI